MDKITLKALGKMAVADQVKIINEGIKAAGGKKEFYEKNDLKANSVNSHMKSIGYSTGKKKDDIFTKIVSSSDSNTIDSKVISSNNSDFNNCNNGDVIYKNEVVSSNNLNINSSKESVIDNDEKMSNISSEVCTPEEDKWAQMDQKSLLKARKEAFLLVVDALEDVNMEDKAFTSLSMYKDVAQKLDVFTKTFKQSKQDVVSAALVKFFAEFEATIKEK